MTVEWLAEQLKEHNIELTETTKTTVSNILSFTC